MNDKVTAKQSSFLATAVRWGLGGFIAWHFMPSETKESIIRSINQLGTDLAIRKQRQLEQERLQQTRDSLANILMGSGAKTPSSVAVVTASQTANNFIKHSPDPDIGWRDKIVHPSVVLVLGKRGSGKSALGYRLLELMRNIASPYVVGVPSSARNLLPDWIGIASSLEDIPPKSIVLIDEAYLHYHSRGSMAATSKAMSQLINLSRQRELTLIFVSQEARQVDKNIASSANVIIFKDLGMLQLEFDRHELNKLAVQARESFALVNEDKRKWSFVYAPDTDFAGLMQNELPSFWKPSLSRLFATDMKPSAPRVAKGLTPQDKARKAKELREQGATYGEIARELGVTRPTVLNYLKSYPYRKKNL